MTPISCAAETRGPSLAAEQQLPRTSTVGRDAAVLAEIFAVTVNMVVWQRQPSAELQGAVKDLISSSRSLSVSMDVSPDDVVENLSEFLGTGANCPLANDVAGLADMFCFLLGIRRVGVRLATLDRAMCPKFHVDRVPCRLITTYNGPGTEWLKHDRVDRSKLGSGSGGLPDHRSGLFRSENDIERLSTGDVALMKGELWENNEGAGLVHRSPAVTDGSVRLMLSFDVSS